MPNVTLGGRAVAYTVRESARARTVRLKISPREGVEVIIPVGAPPLDVEALLRRRAAWILKHYTTPAPLQRQFVTGEQVLYQGQTLTLDVAEKPRGHSISLALDGDTLRLRVPPGTDAPAMRAALESWYRAQAKVYLPRRAAELAQQHGFQYGKITIKGQRARWGSCSSQRNLNFNWRLMLAPPAAIDYVILHELCHLTEMNHSRRFWTLVGRCCPDYQQWVQWFKTNGDRLHLD